MARGRSGNGDREAAALLQREAARLRLRGHTYEQIGQELGLGGRTAAYQFLHRAWENNKVEVARDLEQLRDVEDDRDDDMRRRLYDVLDAKHYVVSDGQVVRDPETGEPLQNADVVLKTIDRLMKLGDRYALRHGLNMEKGLAEMLSRRNDLESSAIVQALLAGVAAVPGITGEQRRVMLEAAAAELQRTQEPDVIAGEIVSGDGS